MRIKVGQRNGFLYDPYLWSNVIQSDQVGYERAEHHDDANQDSDDYCPFDLCLDQYNDPNSPEHRDNDPDQHVLIPSFLMCRC